jgi:hypothetical protein
VVGDLAEDNVLVVKPGGHDRGDKELGPVAKASQLSSPAEHAEGCESLRVGTGVGHGQKEGLVVLHLEVLVGKLLAIDGLATRALPCVSYYPCTYSIPVGIEDELTLPRVKSPPWSMKSGMTRWNLEPA